VMTARRGVTESVRFINGMQTVTTDREHESPHRCAQYGIDDVAADTSTAIEVHGAVVIGIQNRMIERDLIEQMGELAD
jgi:hypothetical protein